MWKVSGLFRCLALINCDYDTGLLQGVNISVGVREQWIVFASLTYGSKHLTCKIGSLPI